VRCRYEWVATLLFFVSLTLPSLLAQVSGEFGQGDKDGVVVLSGAINPRARLENDRGPVGGEKVLSHMTLVLKRTPEQDSALNRLLEEQQDASSPSYHRWLTPLEFGERFGVNQVRLDRILDWLRSEGFTVESTARGRGWVVFSGTVGQVNKAFHTEIHRYQTDGKMHFATAKVPAVPAEFERLVGSIRGLDDFRWESPSRLQPMYTANDGSHALAPGDAATIYGFGSLTARGQGQKIVVTGQSAVDLSDIRTFRSTFGMPDNVPETILVGDDPGFDHDAMQEADADIEWVGVAARDAHIIYVYAADVLDATQAAIDWNLAPIVSLSYGICESNVSSGDAGALRDLARQANAQGITWIASSGDAGAAACDQSSYPARKGLAVSLPASLPEVTGVGGTEFNEGGHDIDYWVPVGYTLPYYSSALRYIPEVAWNGSSATRGLRQRRRGECALSKTRLANRPRSSRKRRQECA
jgi:subtilase family serine protease